MNPEEVEKMLCKRCNAGVVHISGRWHCPVCIWDSHEALLGMLKDMVASGIACDNSRAKYVIMRVDRLTLKNARATIVQAERS